MLPSIWRDCAAGGLSGLLGFLVRPVPAILSLDADHEEHYEEQG